MEKTHWNEQSDSLISSPDLLWPAAQLMQIVTAPAEKWLHLHTSVYSAVFPHTSSFMSAVREETWPLNKASPGRYPEPSQETELLLFHSLSFKCHVT